MAVSSVRSRARRGTRAQRASRALVLLNTLLLTLVATGGFALVHHDAHLATARAAAGRIAVLATIVSSSGVVDPGFGPCATVSYCTPDGREHEATLAMSPSLRPGTTVPLWVTPTGAVTSAPSAASPLRRSLTGWLGIATLAAVAAAACALLARLWAARHDDRLFARIVAPLRAEERSWDRADL